MKEQLPQHEHYLREHRDEEDISELAEKLTPPEELAANSLLDNSLHKNEDAIFVDTERLKLPPGLTESEEAKRGWLGLEPVILVILVLMLAFIAFITYLVYLTPAR